MARPKLVEVRAYDDQWPAAFGRERDELISVLGVAAAAIHHIGSTSVPGLHAKPVIDILVESPSLALIDSATPSLEGRGYEARGEYGVPGRRYFSKTPARALKVHLHVFESGNPRVARHLLLRDYLRVHPPEARRYGELKTRLAETHAGDRDAYQAAKADFINQLHARALEWHERIGRPQG